LFDRGALADGFAKRRGWFAPWSELFANPGAPLNRYPLYVSIMDFLAEKRRDALPRIWDAVRALRDPLHLSAPPAIAGAVGVDAKSLEEEWEGWGADYYRPNGK